MAGANDLLPLDPERAGHHRPPLLPDPDRLFDPEDFLYRSFRSRRRRCRASRAVPREICGSDCKDRTVPVVGSGKGRCIGPFPYPDATFCCFRSPLGDWLVCVL